MRVFVTGATGFIGSAVVAELVAAGHKVVGLARNAAAAEALAKRGAAAHRGSLRDLDSLKRGAAQAEGVIHLAFMHAPSKASLGDLARIFLGAPSGIVRRFMQAATDADRGAIDALASALEGSGRPLLTTFGTLGAAYPRLIDETVDPDPAALAYGRARAEHRVREWAGRGVRAMIVRLPPSVHGAGDKGFAPMIIAAARKHAVSAFVGDGANRWPAAHRLDVARLFRLALETGEAGARYHAVAEEGVAFRDLAQRIGERLNLPVASLNGGKAAKHFGFIAPFVGMDNPTSSARTQAALGWSPREAGLLEDLDKGGYFGG